jgi:FkbM family methyltransferase
MIIKERVRKYLTRRLELPEIPLALERLASMNFKPTHIFDVGAYKGEFAKYCLDIWSNANISCFEALEDKIVQLENLSASNPQIKVFPILVGAENKEAVALHEAETASSVLVEHITQDFPVKYYPMATIDSIVEKHFANHPPDFLKLDVQGYELEILKGAEKSLSQIQVILAEVNFLDIHQNVPLLSDIVIWLNERGWVAYDICGLTRRPLDRALWQADFIFLPHNSPLRADKHWNA